MKKTIFFVAALCCLFSFITNAQPKIQVKEACLPVLLDRQDNVLFYVKITSDNRESFNSLALSFDNLTDLSVVDNVKLYYSGTEGYRAVSDSRFAPVKYISSTFPGRTRKANESYSRLLDEVSLNSKSMRKKLKLGDSGLKKVTLEGEQKLFPGVNYFWVSIKVKPNAPLDSKIALKISDITIDGKESDFSYVTPSSIVHRLGVGVRQAGDDGSASYRIPGLVTTNKGTLLGVYDVRYNSGTDLQEHINIGLSRSTDGGQTWEKMRLPLAFGEYGGLPSAQNGVGDPAILFDTETNTAWVIAIWSWGMGNTRNWHNSLSGNGIDKTSQLVLAKSADDGKTWSEPINITNEVKDPSWRLLLQGPGRGITMTDGTLVFPIQFKDKNDMPHAGIMYSKNHGKTWKITNPARSNTTESQVAELPDGTLMLNMRDNRGGSRAVSVTDDLGVTWKAHPSSRSLLREPVCQASLISVKAEDNVLGKDILIFSNPNVSKGPRRNMTIKLSLDDGKSWSDDYQIMLDEGSSAGYSCLTMLDKETVGILYEGSTSLLTFQTVKLKDLFK